MDNHAKSSEAYNLLHNGIKAFVDIENHGMRLDVKYCKDMQLKIERDIEQEDALFRASSFFKKWRASTTKSINYLSGPQLSNYLYKVLGVAAKKTTDKGEDSTDEEALLSLDIPELKHIIRIKKLKKIKDTYLEGFLREQVDGIIHPVFNLHTVRTFRGSSDSPNFQNIPKRDVEAKTICRDAIFPRAGFHLMEVDYSSIEVRIAACYHKDPTMIKYIKDPTTDMHGDMASQLFLIKQFDKDDEFHSTLRQAAKNGFVFPQFYGDYYVGCANNLAGTWGKLPSTGKWKETQGIQVSPECTLAQHFKSQGIRSMSDFIEHVKEIESHFWNKRFPVYKAWKDKQWAAYQKNGYVDSLTGFRYKGLMDKKDVTNYPVQGAAFHCLLWSLIQANTQLQERNFKTRIFGQIHDAMVLDTHPSETVDVIKLMRNIMCDDLVKHWTWINVPLEIGVECAEVDESWAKLHKYKI